MKIKKRKDFLNKNIYAKNNIFIEIIYFFHNDFITITALVGFVNFA